RTRRPSLLNSCSVRRGGPRALLEEGAEVGFHVQFRLDNIREYRTFDIDASVTWEEGWQISDRYFQSRKDAIGVEMKVRPRPHVSLPSLCLLRRQRSDNRRSRPASRALSETTSVQFDNRALLRDEYER